MEVVDRDGRPLHYNDLYAARIDAVSVRGRGVARPDGVTNCRIATDYGIVTIWRLLCCNIELIC